MAIALTWSRKNPEKRKVIIKKYYASHRSQIAQKRFENKEEQRARSAAWYALHAEKIKQRATAWRKANPAKRKATEHKRRARHKAGGYFTDIEWNVVCKLFHDRCLCCGEEKRLTPDHIIPLSKGGSSRIENIQPLCGRCNTRKGQRIIDYRHLGDSDALRWIKKLIGVTV